jgi:hypothetical protein
VGVPDGGEEADFGKGIGAFARCHARELYLLHSEELPVGEAAHAVDCCVLAAACLGESLVVLQGHRVSNKIDFMASALQMLIRTIRNP